MWQDINTAPRDGTEFLAWNGRREVMNWPTGHYPGQWTMRNGKWFGQGSMREPTKWHPLPDHPKEQA